MRPKLPSAQSLLPYLRRIDELRIYSNFGPLSAEFEDRLAVHFAVPRHGVTTIANGTWGLALALAAQGARPGTLCVVPAWTFIASAQAASMAGLVPFFVDVDASTWALDPEGMSEVIARAPGEVGAVMPVAPFGQPIDFAAWDAFRNLTGLPMVIDAAAGFDAVTATETPVVVSLHATKTLGVGEGGLVISKDTALIRDIRRRANFGFQGSREALVPATNAKLSEYHAAIGLAALDEWDTARAEWLAAAATYRQLLAPSESLAQQPGSGQSWVSSVCVLNLGGPHAVLIEGRLEAAGIESRRWWSEGAHNHPSTLGLPRTEVPVTDRLVQSTIGVPLSRDISIAEIERVVACLMAPNG